MFGMTPLEMAVPGLLAAMGAYTPRTKYRARGLATTKRRYKKRRRRKKYRYQANSAVNRKRKQVALPPVELKLHTPLNHQTTQWATLSSTVWSYYNHLDPVAEGVGENSRISNKITFLPSTFKYVLNQASGNVFTYRIMLVKPLGDTYNMTISNDCTPGSVFNGTPTTTTFPYANYERVENRDDFKFRVVYDKLIVMDSSNGPTVKYVTIKLPRRNVTYDEDEADGEFAQNSLALCVITDATPSSASFTHSAYHQTQFLDS